MSSSIASTIFSVSSIRVPIGARTCSFMIPTSGVGKKSEPTTRPSRKLVPPNATTTTIMKARWRITVARIPP
jgi:hypothetical protein